MTLTPGTCLGPYEVVAPLGAGGMGEVYRARDSRLERDVAIKVLPSAFAADEDRRTRFERESKTLAALSHPNIVAIHDTGLHEDQAYLVMELLTGQSLRDALTGGGVPVRKAIDIAIQVARGLAAAHEKGLVHRDLKPENVFLLEDGRVKVLDFGLARTASAGTGATETGAALTDPGVVMGTVGYMAPEQVRGQVADARADLFALGAVLYEMLTGGRAFQRETAADTMFAIVKEDPPELMPGPGMSPALQPIIRHCLEKHPAERFQTARDVAFALEALSGSGPVRAANAAAPAAHSPRERRWRALAGVSVSAAVVAIAYALSSPGSTGALPGEPADSGGRFSINLTEPAAPVVLGAGGQWPAPAFALSPDGRTLVYVGQVGALNQLFVRKLSDLDVRPLADTRGAWGPFFSPDGEWVGFFVGDQLNKVAVAEGAPIPLGAFNTPTSAVWLPNGRIVVAESEGYVFTAVSDQGGNRETRQKLLEGGMLNAALDDEWLLAGRRLMSPREARWLVTGGIVADPLSWFTERYVQVGATQYLAGDPGALVWVEGGRLSGVPFAMPFGGAPRRFDQGTVVVLPDQVNEPFPGVADLAVARSGVAVYAPPVAQNAPLKIAVPQGAHETLPLPEASYLQPAWSPDGRRVAVNVNTKPGAQLRLVDAHGKSELLVTSPSYLGSPRWRLPDGRSLLYTENPWTPAATVFEIDAAPGAEPRQVSGRGDGTLVGLTPDGSLVLQPVDLNRGLEIRLADGARRVLTDRPHSAAAQYTMDGTWVVWSSIAAGQWDVYVAPTDSSTSVPGSPRRVTDFGCDLPRWGAGARTIVCQGQDDLFEIPVVRQGTTLEPGRPRPLGLGRIMKSTSGDQSFDVDANGRIIFVPETGPMTTRELRVVTNLLRVFAPGGLVHSTAAR